MPAVEHASIPLPFQTFLMKKPVSILALVFVASVACAQPAIAVQQAEKATAETDAGAVQRAGPPCDGSQQDSAACAREAGAAKQEARRGGLTIPGPAAEKDNALERCNAQPPAARAECEARITGAGKTSVEGSVLGGGLIRETTTPVEPGR